MRQELGVLVLHPNLVVDDAIVQFGEMLGGEVLSVVDAAVVAKETLLSHLVLHLRVVRVRVQHDDGERKHVGGVCGLVRAGVLPAVPLGELLHQPIDLLRFPRKSETLQKFTNRLVQGLPREVHRVDVGMHHRQVGLLALAEVIADDGLVQIRSRAQKLGDLRGGGPEAPNLLHERDALLRLLVEESHRLLVFQLGRLLLLDAGHLADHRGRRDGLSIVRGARGGLRRLGQFGRFFRLRRRARPELVVHPPAERREHPAETLERLCLEYRLASRLRARQIRHARESLRDANEGVYQSLEEVAGVEVAVKVDKEVHQQLRVGAQLVQAHQEDGALGVGRERGAVHHLEGLEHEHGEEEAHLRLERRPKLGQEGEEDGARQLVRRGNRGRRVRHHRVAQVLRDGRHESLGRAEHGSRVLEENLEQLQRERLPPHHRHVLQIPGFLRQLTQRTEHEESVRLQIAPLFAFPVRRLARARGPRGLGVLVRASRPRRRRVVVVEFLLRHLLFRQPRRNLQDVLLRRAHRHGDVGDVRAHLIDEPLDVVDHLSGDVVVLPGARSNQIGDDDGRRGRLRAVRLEPMKHHRQHLRQTRLGGRLIHLGLGPQEDVVTRAHDAKQRPRANAKVLGRHRREQTLEHLQLNRLLQHLARPADELHDLTRVAIRARTRRAGQHGGGGVGRRRRGGSLDRGCRRRRRRHRAVLFLAHGI